MTSTGPAARRCTGSWKTRSGRLCAAAGSPPGPGCRPPGCWPASLAARGGSWWRPTCSWAPRDVPGAPEGGQPARSSPSPCRSGRHPDIRPAQRPPAVPPSPRVVIDFEPEACRTWQRSLLRLACAVPAAGPCAVADPAGLNYGQAGSAAYTAPGHGQVPGAGPRGARRRRRHHCLRRGHSRAHPAVRGAAPARAPQHRGGRPRLAAGAQRGPQAGTDPLSVPVDGEGILVAALQQLPARAVLVTPAHQFPRGRGLVRGAARRHCWPGPAIGTR